MDQKTEQFLRLLASKNVCDGVLYEPRAYFDVIDFSTAVNPSTGAPDVFRNGEEYPVRITHVVGAIKYTGVTSPNAFPTGDERAIQQYGIRIRGHDTYYMNPDFVAFPCWHNRPTAASDIATRAQSSWRFWRPFYMGQRDVLEVKIAMTVAVGSNDGNVRIGCSFEGVGALSRRPKKLYGFVDVANADSTNVIAIPTDFYRNDGAEPLEIHQMVVHAVGGTLVSDPVGEIRNPRFSIKLIGNGTNSRWTIGPITNPPALSDNFMPGPLWGPTTGRSIVHALAEGSDGHPGWLWYPGEGVSFEIDALTSRTDAVYFGLLGHVIIK